MASTSGPVGFGGEYSPPFIEGVLTTGGGSGTSCLAGNIPRPSLKELLIRVGNVLHDRLAGNIPRPSLKHRHGHCRRHSESMFG